MPLVVSLFLECVHSWPLLAFVYLCLARRTLNHNSREKWRVLTVLVMCVRLCAALPRQQVRSGICHAGVGSAPLTSLSSLDKDGRNLPLPLFLSPHSPALPLSPSLPPSVLLLHHLSPVSFCLPESCSIFTAATSSSLPCSHRFAYSLCPSAWELISPVCCFWCCWVDTACLSYLVWQVRVACSDMEW